LLFTVRDKPVPGLKTLTFAPETAAPLLSVMIP